MVVIFAYTGCAPSDIVRQEAIARYNELVKSPTYVRLFYKDGAPYLTEKKHISISHTNTPDSERIEFIAIADNEVGVDVEYKKRNINVAIAKRYFAPDEREYIGDDKERCLEIWQKREAYGKSLKVGVYRESVMNITDFVSYEVYEGYNTVIYSKDKRIVFMAI